MVSKKLEATRKKGRRNRVTIEDQYLGPEPIFNPGETTPDKVENKVRLSLWTKGAHWYNYFYKTKDYVPYVIDFVEEVCGLTKEEANTIKKLKDHQITFPLGKSARLFYRGYEYTKEEIETFTKSAREKLEDAKLVEEVLEEKKKDAPKVISIAERTRRKMMDSIYGEFDEVIVEGWLNKDYKQTIDVFGLFKKHNLKGNAVAPFKKIIDKYYEEIEDALHKRCEQAVEGYSHVSTANKKKMIKQMDTIYADLDSLQLSFKASRTPRARKPKASDAQVKNLKYNIEDMEYKLTSINPIQIPGKETLWVFNTKTRNLYEYVTNSTKGFEVGGTTIKSFDEKLSRCTKLRKPDVILPLILTKTAKQIEKQVWKDQITTKVNSPNGRINQDCILLRIL